MVPEDLGDEMAGDLGRDSVGAEVRPAGKGHSCLRLFFASRAEAERAVPHIARAVARWGIDREACDLVIEDVADESWVERYQARLRPFPLGAGFVVVPGQDTGGFDDRIRLRLSPGRAFGTGEHPTTRLCVAALETWVRPGSRWIDVGTGSGILAVVAANRGAAAVVAIDIDPDAVTVARETVRRNEVGDRVVVEVGVLDDSRGVFDGAVANIISRYFVSECSSLAACVREGGVLLASGLERGELGEVRAVLVGAGFRTVADAVDGDWAIGVFKRVSGARA